MNIVYSIAGTPITNRVSFLKEGGSYVTAAFRGEVGTGGVRIEDPAGNLTISGWQIFSVDDMDASPTMVWQGYIWDRTQARGELPPAGAARVHDCDLVDGNYAWQFQILHLNAAKRPAETDVARATWLSTSEAFDAYGNILFQAPDLISATNPVDLLATDCRGSFANAVLRTLAEISNKNFFPYIDEYTGLAGLFYGPDDEAVYSSTIRISNVIADEDGTTTFFPFKDAELHQSAADRYGGALFNWQGDPVYVQSPSTIASMGGIVRDASISDQKQIGAAATAETEAQAFLNSHAAEAHTIRCSILMPSESVTLLRAGHRMEVKFTHLEGYEAFTWTRVRRMGVHPVGVDVQGTWTVLWQADLELWVPPGPVDDAAIPSCDVTITQTKANEIGVSFIYFDTPTVAGKVLFLYEAKRDEPGGAAGVWTALSADVSTDGTAGGDHGRWWYRNSSDDDLPFDLTTYEIGTGDCFAYETDIDFATFVPGDVSLYEVDNANSATLGLGAVTAPSSGQLILYGATYDTAFNGSLPATAGAGWSMDWNANANSANPPVGASDQHPHWLVMTWDGTTSPLTGAATIASAMPYAGVMIQVGSGCEEALPYAGDPVSETPTGTVNNSNTDFATPGPFLPGTLRVLHDGIDQTAHVTTSDPVAGTFTLDYAPSFGSTMRTVYESA